MKWSFFPDETPEFKRKRKPSRQSWKAPEHARASLDMRRDRQGNLVVDPRPAIMVPERPKIYPGLYFPNP